jgi:hypothetical protein
MEHEREPLGGGQGVKHDEKCEADRVRQQRLFFGLQLAVRADDRVGQVLLIGILAPPVPRPEHGSG